MTTDEQRAHKRELLIARKARDPDAYHAQAREATARYRAKPENARKGAEYMAAKRAGYTDEEAAEAQRKHREEMVTPHNQRRTKNRYTLRKYDLTLEEYEQVYAALLESQEGRCAACGDEPQSKEPLNLDHHHTTGRIRALLCGNCNRSLGMLREDPKRIAALLAYVEKHS